MKCMILDGNSIVNRAFYGVRALTAPDGTPTNAVYGFLAILQRLLDEQKPDALCVSFDLKAPTFRHLADADYKATRHPMPEELAVQMPLLKETLDGMGIRRYEKEGYEADDILGTVSARCEKAGWDCVIVTGDKDSLQLVTERTTVCHVKSRMGQTETILYTPERFREEYGFEPKRMVDLKALMGDTSDNIPGVPGVGEKTALKLVQQYGSLRAVLDSAEAEQKGKLRERLIEGRALAEMSYDLAKIDRNAPVEADPEAWRLGNLAAAAPRLRELRMNAALRRLLEVAKAVSPQLAVEPAAPAEAEALPEIERFAERDALAARIMQLSGTAKWASVHMGAEFTVATDAARLAMAMGGDLLSPGVTDAEAWSAVMPLLEADCPVVLCDMKSAPVDIRRIRGDITDVMLAAYALNPQRPGFDARSLCEQEGVEGYDRHPATAIRRLALAQAEQLRENDLERVYRDIELPLCYVLRGMEDEGFLVDADVLRGLGVEFKKHIQRLTDEIAELAGERINLNSPKQLGELLFGKLGIPSPKKKISTNAEVLEQLSEDWPICGKVLEYRKYQKLESTYIDALIPMRDAGGRIHTRFDPVGTATGRISSAEPNLQNIPVRTELGRAIRGAFVARPGYLLVDADYSQIELRVLAHMSGDKTTINAFLMDQDIHARTAAEVYGVPLEMVTHQMRSASKAVNFGIVYGISEFTLARNIGVSRYEAKEFIDRYFERYPGVKAYMDDAVKRGHAQGYVTTLMNRRAFGERCAMNSPIQGTAADIIKLAMIAVDRALREEGFRAKLILQVHDELIVEAPEEEAERVRELLRRCMEGVMKLSVPLRTDISIGGDWRACK